MYYSEDFCDKKGRFEFGERLLEYFNNNHLRDTNRPSDWRKKLEGINRGKTLTGDIELLINCGIINFDGDALSEASISLKTISGMLPRSKKPRIDDYKFLLQTL